MQTDCDEIHQEEVESVSPHIFNQSGQIEGCKRETAAETASRAKCYSVAPTSLASHNNLKTSLWPENMERRQASVSLVK